MKKAVCFGEVLWDVFPDKARIGGAPLNVAYRLSKSGISTQIISQVGKDPEGKKLLAFLKKNEIGTSSVNMVNSFPTGKVLVTLNKNGAATYEIVYPSAWDKIELQKPMLKTVKEADVFIFGSLICRDKISRETLFALLPHANCKIFDLNLRPPYYDHKLLIELMELADFIKFNDDELIEIAELLNSPYHSLEKNLLFISERTNTGTICVTKGGHGAVLFVNGKLFYNSGYKIKVKDTVGAGDSFLASLVAKLLLNKDPQEAIDHACAVGALVASKEGANPVLTGEEIEKFISP